MLIVAIVPGPAEATEYVSGATCTIDNDDTVNESQVFLSGAEFKNDDDTNDAYLTCGIPLTAGTPDDVDVIQAYVYDGNNDAGTAVVGTVYWHGTTSGNWDACTTEDTDSTSTFTGNATDLSWSVYPGTENLDCLTGRGSGSAFMNVVLPDDDAACGGSCVPPCTLMGPPELQGDGTRGVSRAHRVRRMADRGLGVEWLATPSAASFAWVGRASW